ncbi:translationally-controlled tumor protein [Kalaharituber pfeilii]|nr:translationally-controlled tumor protein [Kalaharituber pfeilii]
MIIYKDILSDDEMFSDAFNPKLVDDMFYEVDCQNIAISKGFDVNIGANPSAEQAEETSDNGSTTMNNVIHCFNLVQTNIFNQPTEKEPLKKDERAYRRFLTAYLKRTVAEFRKANPTKSNEELHKLLMNSREEMVAKCNDCLLFTGASMNLYTTNESNESIVGSMIAHQGWREDGRTEYFIFWKHGLKEEKV